MAQRSVAQFKTVKESRYADNSTGNVSAADSRDMFEDTADSFVNWTDAVIDDDTFATASSDTVPTSESVKAYVDNAVDNSSIIRKRVATGSVANGSAVEITITWDTPFADTNYTVVATLEQSSPGIFSGFMVQMIKDRTEASIDVLIVNTSASAKEGVVNIIAIHD